MNRRSYLVLGVTIGTSGCLEFFDQEVYLGGLRLENTSEADHSVEIRVGKDGGQVHESTVDISGMEDDENVLSTEFVECEWPNDESGEFEIAARLTGDDSWVETTSDDTEGDDSCQMVFLRIEETGTLWFNWDDCERYEAENPDTVCGYGTG
ncbi:hypothetical protein ACFOZ7_14665 [Natribaculum luteum]|uniref:Lipoprotein n=1 Tax=Natribaculum luteum TaxID=1586232 RepID=A0ABD5P235_9EURY|nr:hypothetical protein [Natribaculum luteum]